MNPSPQVRSAIYIVLAVANIVTAVFLLMTGRFNNEVLLGLTAINSLVMGLANANVSQ